jgi:multimeric flavodoxin WrbA
MNKENTVNITQILGSPRKNGNGATLAGRFADVAKGLGVDVKTFFLNDLNFRGCQACMSCKGKLDRCAVQDDVTTVFESMRNADVIVAATPIYSGYASGQFKCFMDRCYSLISPDYMTNPEPSRLPPGKKAVLIVTQGNPDPTLFGPSISNLQMWIKRNWRIVDVSTITCYGIRAASDLDPFLKEAEDLAKAMCR